MLPHCKIVFLWTLDRIVFYIFYIFLPFLQSLYSFINLCVYVFYWIFEDWIHFQHLICCSGFGLAAQLNHGCCTWMMAWLLIISLLKLHYHKTNFVLMTLSKDHRNLPGIRIFFLTAVLCFFLTSSKSRMRYHFIFYQFMNKQAFCFPWCKYKNISIEVIIKSQTLSCNLYKFSLLKKTTYLSTKRLNYIWLRFTVSPFLVYSSNSSQFLIARQALICKKG